MKTRHLLSVLVMLLFATSSAFAVETGYYLVGNFNSWSPQDNYKFVANETAAGEYMITVNLAAGDELKAIHFDGDNSTTTYYPSNAINYVVSETGNYTVYFRPNYNGNDDWYAKCIYLFKNADAPAVFSLTAEPNVYGSTVTFKLGGIMETTTAKEGEPVTIFIQPGDYVAVDQVTAVASASASDANAPLKANSPELTKEITITEVEGVYTFTMPAANVKVTVTYVGTTDKTALNESITAATTWMDTFGQDTSLSEVANNLQNAINAANAVMDKVNVSPEEVAEAKTALDAALNAANEAVTKPVTRTIAAGKYATAYFEDMRTLAAGMDGVKLYTITAVNGTQLTLTEFTAEVPANTPFLIYNSSEEAKEVKLNAVPNGGSTPAYPTAAAEFKGTTVAKSFTEDEWNGYDFYVLTGSNFYWVSENNSQIPANRCWIQLPKTAAPAPSLSFVDGEGTTGIENIAQPSTLSNQPIYDLNGRRVAQPTKGLYIINGKKVILK